MEALARRVANSLGLLLLLLFGNEPKLLHKAHVIPAIPLLDYLATLDAVYGDALGLYLPASGRAKLLHLSLVSTAYRNAGDYLLTFGYHVLDGCAHVGEGALEHGDKLLGLLYALDVSFRIVPDDIWGVDLV